MYSDLVSDPVSRTKPSHRLIHAMMEVRFTTMVVVMSGYTIAPESPAIQQTYEINQLAVLGETTTDCGHTSLDIKRPDDFSVSYEWQEGSLPPPYHYEYQISLQSSGQGKVTMVPDYPSAGVPVWTETFAIQPNSLNELYRLMITQCVLVTDWQAPTHPLVGGPLESMQVTAHGKQIKVPASLIPQQASLVKKIYSAVTALVPKAIWEKLSTLRAQYIREHQKRS